MENRNQTRMKMEEIVKLGGNIELSGFEHLDQAHMLIIRKIIGNHVKELIDSDPEYKGLHITLNDTEGFAFEAKLVTKTEKTATHSDSNVLMGIDKVIKKVRDN